MNETYPALAHEGYTAAVNNLHRLRQEARDNEHTLERVRGINRHGIDALGRPRYADGDLSEAIRLDDIDRAQAAVEGKRDPGCKREDQVRADIAKAVDTSRILAGAVEQAEHTVRTLLHDEREALAVVVAGQVEESRQEYGAALERLLAARAGFHASRRLTTWVASPDRPYKTAVAPPLAALRSMSRNGEPVEVEPIWDALRGEFTVAEPVRVPIRYEHKRERIVRGGRLVEDRLTAVPVYDDEAASIDRDGEPVLPPLHVGGVPVFADLGADDRD